MKYLVSILAVACFLQQGKAESTNLVAKASNTFANNLYQKVAKTPGNVLVCPISLHIALGLVLQGAGNNTSAELASVLEFGAVNDDIKNNYKSILTGLKDNTLKIATKLYPADNFKINSNYVSIAQQYFLSDVEGVDYSKPIEASNKINKYVEEHTNNKIHDLIKPDVISGLTKLIIINAVHFQATWKKTFASSYEDYFKVSPTEKVLTKMMSMTDYFHYKEDSALDAKVLKMDYSDAGYSMIFVLPNKEDGLPALEQKLVHTDLEKLLAGMQETKVEVTIPKFKLEKTIDLKQILIDMGIKDVFSSRADLHGIASGESLYVSDVIQKTFINVHENGTEAAAATGYILELLSANTDTVIFSAQWPFHFMLIYNQRSRMILFEGRLTRLSADIITPQESNQHVQISDQDKINIVEDKAQNKKPTLNSDYKPDQQFKPDLFNNKVTSSDRVSNPHVTGNSTHDQTNSKDSDIRYPDYSEKPTYENNNRIINHNSNNLVHLTTTTFPLSQQQIQNISKNHSHKHQKPYQHTTV